jgi:hypothetical protein
MWGNALDTGAFARRGEAFLDIPDAVAVNVENVTQIAPATPCAAQVRQQSPRDRNDTAPLFGPSSTRQFKIYCAGF